MFRFLTLLCVAFYLPLTAYAKSYDSFGYWLTENKHAVIYTYECKQGLCGNIHWIMKDGMQYDKNNPDDTKRKNPMCDLKIIWGFEKDGKNWKNGKIYKADDGDIYSADIQLKDENTLLLRGYVGVPLFGESQIWTRVSKNDYEKCKVP